ncbi:uncharacterized protein LOC121858940 [Homarus americanus]|uniref:uncharacterized protein LOC121858940 n=1 Tax=Homarus americanus TaxID=6706 RepID=UPI001C4930BD|nr:uncharacterized protein LOC121858940 [Homarus americanus]
MASVEVCEEQEAQEESIYNTVTSEVHHFSKEEVLHDTPGGKETFGQSKVLSLLPEAETDGPPQCVAQLNTEVHHQQQEEEEEFECFLGANGQVVLWSSRRETVLSRFDFVYPSHMVVEQQRVVTSPVIDCDGDLQVTRKKDLHKKESAVLIG